MTLDATTQLSAVNTILSVIGEAPVSTLIGSTSADVSAAIQVLDEVVLELLSERWDFNYETAFPLIADGTGTIYVSSTFIDVRPTDRSRSLIVRGTRVYDKDRRSYTFTPGETIDFDVTVRLPFDEMPETARHYAAIKAARRFSNRSVGDQLGNAFTSQDEAAARSAFRKSVVRIARPNLMRKSNAILRILDRSR